MRLLWKLLTRIIVLLAILLFALGWLQYMSMKDFLYNSVEATLRSQLHEIPPGQLAGINTEDALRLRSSDLVHSLAAPELSVVVLDGSGAVILINAPPKQRNSIPILGQQIYSQAWTAPPGFQKKGYFLFQGAHTDSLVVLMPLGPPHHPVGVLQVSTPLTHVQDILKQQVWTAFGASSILLLMAIVIGVPLLNQQLRPLHNMVDITEKISASNLTHRIEMGEGNDEVHRLGNAFNRMLDRLESSFESERQVHDKMRNFVADASHELRTPLTSIQGFLEVLQMGAQRDPRKVSQALQSMSAESQRLSKLVSDLLLLARLDQKQAPSKILLDLNKVIAEVKASLLVLSGSRKIVWHLNATKKIVGNPDQLKQVLYNLVQNSVQHTDPVSGTLWIQTQNVDSHRVSLTCKDNGVGVPHEIQDKIFDRFFRGQQDRARTTGGAGLGLSIVSEIVQAHRAAITLASEVGKGTSITITFPIGESKID